MTGMVRHMYIKTAAEGALTATRREDGPASDTLQMNAPFKLIF